MTVNVDVVVNVNAFRNESGTRARSVQGTGLTSRVNSSEEFEAPAGEAGTA